MRTHAAEHSSSGVTFAPRWDFLSMKTAALGAQHSSASTEQCFGPPQDLHSKQHHVNIRHEHSHHAGSRSLHFLLSIAAHMQIVTLRTMKNALTSILARVHDASCRLRVTPAFKSDANSDDDVAAGADAAGAAAAIADPGNGSSTAGEESPRRRPQRNGGPVEQEEGSTARAVAAAVEMFSGELLDAADELNRLQAQLNRQHEGCALCTLHLTFCHTEVLLLVPARRVADAASV